MPARYHLGRAVLLGDAAHSTGGASGQGCNSALQDAISLADALERSGGAFWLQHRCRRCCCCCAAAAAAAQQQQLAH